MNINPRRQKNLKNTQNKLNQKSEFTPNNIRKISTFTV